MLRLNLPHFSAFFIASLAIIALLPNCSKWLILRTCAQKALVHDINILFMPPTLFFNLIHDVSMTMYDMILISSVSITIAGACGLERRLG